MISPPNKQSRFLREHPLGQPFPYSLKGLKKGQRIGSFLGLALNSILVVMALRLGTLSLDNLEWIFILKMIGMGFLLLILVVVYGLVGSHVGMKKAFQAIKMTDQGQFLEYILPLFYLSQKPANTGKMNANVVNDALRYYLHSSSLFYTQTLASNTTFHQKMEEILKEHPLKPSNYSTISKLAWPSIRDKIEERSVAGNLIVMIILNGAFVVILFQLYRFF